MGIARCIRGQVAGFWGVPIYHVLFAVYFPLWLFSNNRGLFDTADLCRPLIVSMGLALAAFAALTFLFRDSHKAAFLTGVGIACMYSFSVLRGGLPMTSAGTGALVVLGAIWTGAALLAVKTRKGPWRAVSKILNAFVAAMLLLPLAKIADLHVGKPSHTRTIAGKYALQATARAVRPNIIHIVLDGYSRSDVLKALYAWDNSSFVRSLQELGFFVSARATSAYSQTLLSMNSIFSLNYINDRVSALAASKSNEELRLALNKSLQNSDLLKLLKSLGYKLIIVDSLYRGVHLDNADQIVWEPRLQVSYFEKTLLGFTPIGRIVQRLAVNDATFAKVRFALGKHDYSNITPPFIVYNHVVSPHPPFNITVDGQLRPNSFDGMGDGSHRQKTELAWYEEYRKGYVAKLSYTNTAILQKIRSLLATVPDPKIIILHSDHGGGMFLDKENKGRSCLKERMSSFLAVYSSNRDLLREFPDRINMVNLYRILLSRAFGANVPPLPEHSYFSPWEAPSAFEEISKADLETFGPECSPQRDQIDTHR